MTRALSAAAKSGLVALIDRHHLDAIEIVDLGIDLAVRHHKAALLDIRDLHARLDDALAARAVKGEARDE